MVFTLFIKHGISYHGYIRSYFKTKSLKITAITCCAASAGLCGSGVGGNCNWADLTQGLCCDHWDEVAVPEADSNLLTHLSPDLATQTPGTH